MESCTTRVERHSNGRKIYRKSGPRVPLFATSRSIRAACYLPSITSTVHVTKPRPAPFLQESSTDSAFVPERTQRERAHGREALTAISPAPICDCPSRNARCGPTGGDLFTGPRKTEGRPICKPASVPSVAADETRAADPNTAAPAGPRHGGAVEAVIQRSRASKGGRASVRCQEAAAAVYETHPHRRAPQRTASQREARLL